MTAVVDTWFENDVTELKIDGVAVPWRFSSLQDDYTALRSKAGLLDLRSLGLLELTGDALPFLQRVLARDVEYMSPDSCLSSLVLTPEGEPIDIVTLYPLDDRMLLESSLGCARRLREHLESLAGDDVTVRDVTSELWMIGLEGPYSWTGVGRVVDPELTALPFESVARTEWDGAEVIFGRSGFSAEYGYKLIAAPEVAAQLWQALRPHAEPAGLEALELAMLETRQPVLRHEAGPWGVIGAGLNWLIDVTKEEFIGREAILQQFSDGASEQAVGLRLPGEEVPESGTPVSIDGVVVGSVRHAAYSPGLDGVLVLAGLRSEVASPGLQVNVGEGGNETEAETLASPYVVPLSWSTPIL